MTTATRTPTPVIEDQAEAARMLLWNSHRPGRRIGSGRKLTDEQVLEIRQRYATGTVAQATLANEHGLSQATIARIVAGTHYADVGGL